MTGGPVTGSLAPGHRSATPLWYDGLLGGHRYDVVYEDAHGYPLIAFAGGQWYDVTTFTPRPVSVRHAVRRDTAWAGAVVQTVCLWMRHHPEEERSFELATELALAVGELARSAQSAPRSGS